MSNDKQFFIDPSVDSPIRFDMRRFLEFTDNLDPLTSAFLADIKTLPLGGYFVVSTEEFRPDSVSFKVYGSEQYFWVIMIYNDLEDINQIVAGQSLKFPAQQDLEDLYFQLKARQSGQTA